MGHKRHQGDRQNQACGGATRRDVVVHVHLSMILQHLRDLHSHIIAFDATRRRCLSRSVTSSPIICCRRAVRAFLSRCSRNSLRFSLSTCSMPAGTASPCDESGVIDCSSGLSRAPNRRCALLGPGRGGTGPENACCMIGRSPLRSAARPCAN